MGKFYLVTRKGIGTTATPLPKIPSPANRDEYVRDVAVPNENFRVTDLLLVDTDKPHVRLAYVAHHYWNAAGSCLYLALSEAEIDLDNLNQPVTWTQRWHTTPCISKDIKILNETGGRIALLSPSTLLLTVGTTVPDSVWGTKELIDDPNNTYGKIIEIDRNTWHGEVYSYGHRNPQGLLVDNGVVWSTEHGPEGGDELNLVVKGGDYGWPRASYGTDYGAKTLTGSDTPGRHNVGIRPLYAWVPSIGISRLIRVRGDAFPEWKGDLLITSLSGYRAEYGGSIFRVRVVEGRVELVERIPLNMRLRDIAEMGDGSLVLWGGRNRLVTVTPGTQVFSPCSGCHAIEPAKWAKNGIGPDLNGIVGAKVATVENFSYSKAMQDFGGTWSKARLDYFLKDPQAVVPGTKMAFEGIKDPRQRREIIQYIEQASLAKR